MEIIQFSGLFDGHKMASDRGLPVWKEWSKFGGVKTLISYFCDLLLSVFFSPSLSSPPLWPNVSKFVLFSRVLYLLMNDGTEGYNVTIFRVFKYDD